MDKRTENDAKRSERMIREALRGAPCECCVEPISYTITVGPISGGCVCDVCGFGKKPRDTDPDAPAAEAAQEASKHQGYNPGSVSGCVRKDIECDDCTAIDVCDQWKGYCQKLIDKQDKRKAENAELREMNRDLSAEVVRLERQAATEPVHGEPGPPTGGCSTSHVCSLRDCCGRRRSVVVKQLAAITADRDSGRVTLKRTVGERDAARTIKEGLSKRVVELNSQRDRLKAENAKLEKQLKEMTVYRNTWRENQGETEVEKDGVETQLAAMTTERDAACRNRDEWKHQVDVAQIARTKVFDDLAKVTAERDAWKSKIQAAIIKLRSAATYVAADEKMLPRESKERFHVGCTLGYIRADIKYLENL